jgi:hypothetical protein
MLGIGMMLFGFVNFFLNEPNLVTLAVLNSVVGDNVEEAKVETI